MPIQLILAILLAILAFACSYLAKPIILGRAFRTLFLACVTAFCGFGFLASFEIPGSYLGQVIYAALGVMAATGASLPWILSSTATGQN